jgi:DNA-binding transcriptional MocR family regulator
MGGNMKSVYGRVPARAATAGLSRAAHQVLTLICCVYADRKTGQAYPSTNTMAQDLGLHRRTVQRAIRGLKRSGLIRVDRRRDVAGDAGSNLYTVLLRPDGVVADAPPRSGTDAATVVAGGFAEVVAQAPPKQEPMNKMRAHAREGGSPDGRRRSRSSTEELKRRLHEDAYREHGIWRPDWGDKPSFEAAA